MYVILKINNARYNKNCNYNTFLKNKHIKYRAFQIS